MSPVGEADFSYAGRNLPRAHRRTGNRGRLFCAASRFLRYRALVYGNFVELLFHPLSVRDASLTRSGRSLSLSPESEAERVAFPRNEINAQGTRTRALRHREREAAGAAPPRPRRAGRKRKETLYRHVETVKGKPGENGVARARPRQKGPFVLVCALQGEFCHSHTLERARAYERA